MKSLQTESTNIAAERTGPLHSDADLMASEFVCEDGQSENNRSTTAV